MAFDTDILKEKIEKIENAFESGQYADVLVGALNTGNALLQQRVFTQNEDAQGNSFGKYVGKKTKTKLKSSKNAVQNKRNKAIVGLDLTAYQRKRAALGAQTNPKNLQLTGNLKLSIDTFAENENAAVLAFTNNEAAKIAHGQEVQITNIRNGLKGTTTGIGIKIFRLNTTEREQIVEQGKALIKQVIDQNKK